MSKEQNQQGEGTGRSSARGPGRGPAMGIPVEKAKDFKGTIKRLAGYLKPYKFSIVFVAFMAVLSTTFTIVSPKLLGDATTSIFNSWSEGIGVDFGYIGKLLIVLLGLYVLSAIFTYVQQFVMVRIAQRTVFALRQDVNDKLARMPLAYFDRVPHGEVLSRAVNDVDNISNTMQQSLMQLITAIITLVGVVGMMLWISPIMTLVVLLTLPLSFIVTKSIAKRSQAYFKGQQTALGELNGHVEEMYTGHSIVKAYGREQQSIEQFGEINERLYTSGWKAQFISGIIMPLMNLINNLGYVLICVVGGVLVMNRMLAIGEVQAFIQYARQFSQPIVQTANIANIIQSTVASAERVFELLDEQEEVTETNQDERMLEPTGNVRFEQVSFRYLKDEPLIEDLNIDVQEGQKVAIVGPTGAGKTTLVNLLMRFYEVTDGSIKVGGIDIRDLKRGTLRRMFGMVLQDTWLFNGTIRDNIAYGREDATSEEVEEAARAAYADHFIRTLPNGYDTVLNEEGSNISQGQKQLLTIARAILAEPSILILDEATSSVDTRTEVHIQKAMNRLMEGRTSFVIAHRLSTIQGADVILVMHDGRVIEKGSHQELLEQEGFYADLYHSQFTAGVG